MRRVVWKSEDYWRLRGVGVGDMRIIRSSEGSAEIVKGNLGRWRWSEGFPKQWSSLFPQAHLGVVFTFSS